MSPEIRTTCQKVDDHPYTFSGKIPNTFSRSPHCSLPNWLSKAGQTPKFRPMAIPNFVYQTAFAIAFLNTLLVLWTLCKIIHSLPGLGSKQKRHEYSIATSSICFKYLMIKPCPWIKVHGLDQLEESWREVAKTGTPYILANHNSKLDSLLITGLLPVWLGPKMRSLIKEALFSEPLFGGICSAVGHFPVYYKGTTEGMRREHILTYICNSTGTFLTCPTLIML